MLPAGAEAFTKSHDKRTQEALQSSRENLIRTIEGLGGENLPGMFRALWSISSNRKEGFLRMLTVVIIVPFPLPLSCPVLLLPKLFCLKTSEHRALFLCQAMESWWCNVGYLGPSGAGWYGESGSH